jgi:signal transduction histidine kinase
MLQAATAQGHVEDENWRLRKDGSRFWANVVITALTDHEGRLRGFAKVTRDLTERRRAEEQARELAQAQIARAAAEEGMKARDRFLSIASHELRTPLNPLQLHIQLLLKAARDGTLNGPIRGRVAGMLESCERQVKQFSRIVNELLDISRIASGRLELRPARVDLAEVVRDVAARSRPELEQRGSELRVRTNGPVVGEWDPGRVEELVVNLLSNAMKYGRGKPIQMTVEAAPDCACLAVRDEGIGIAPADQERIFECFERAVSGPDYGGLGIGLYLVREIVRAHGGTVGVASAPGAGATFTVELPYVRPATPGTADSQAAVP